MVQQLHLIFPVAFVTGQHYKKLRKQSFSALLVTVPGEGEGGYKNVHESGPWVVPSSAFEKT